MRGETCGWFALKVLDVSGAISVHLPVAVIFADKPLQLSFPVFFIGLFYYLFIYFRGSGHRYLLLVQCGAPKDPAAF